jgi:hypothetical protein
MLADLMFVLNQFVLQGLLGICGSGRVLLTQDSTAPLDCLSHQLPASL